MHGINIPVVTGCQKLPLGVPCDWRDARHGWAFKLGPALLLEVKHGQDIDKASVYGSEVASLFVRQLFRRVFAQFFILFWIKLRNETVNKQGWMNTSSDRQVRSKEVAKGKVLIRMRNTNNFITFCSPFFSARISSTISPSYSNLVMLQPDR